MVRNWPSDTHDGEGGRVQDLAKCLRCGGVEWLTCDVDQELDCSSAPSTDLVVDEVAWLKKQHDVQDGALGRRGAFGASA